MKANEEVVHQAWFYTILPPQYTAKIQYLGEIWSTLLTAFFCKLSLPCYAGLSPLRWTRCSVMTNMPSLPRYGVDSHIYTLDPKNDTKAMSRTMVEPWGLNHSGRVTSTGRDRDSNVLSKESLAGNRCPQKQGYADICWSTLKPEH